MLFDRFTFLFYHSLINFKNFIGLSTELEISETESCFDKHENWNFSFQRESISGKIVTIYGLLKLSDLLGAEREHLEKW